MNKNYLMLVWHEGYNMNGDKLKIEITEGEEFSYLEMTRADGKKEYKTISFFDFIEAVRNEAPVTTGLLPPGTRIFGGSESNFSIIIEQPPMKYVIVTNYQELKKITVPLPATLFGAKVVNSKLSIVRIVSFIGPLLNESKPLYYFPYGNCNPEVCWGSARISNITGPKGIYSLIAKFMDSHFNGDLWYINGYNSFYNFINDMSQKDEFPEKHLAQLNCTFSGFKNNLFL